MRHITVQVPDLDLVPIFVKTESKFIEFGIITISLNCAPNKVQDWIRVLLKGSVFVLSELIETSSFKIIEATSEYSFTYSDGKLTLKYNTHPSVF